MLKKFKIILAAIFCLASFSFLNLILSPIAQAEAVPNCSLCGQGLLNTCDEKECYSLGDCEFEKNWYDISGICKNKIKVVFSVLDGQTEQAILAASIKIYEGGRYVDSCTTGDKDTCSIFLSAAREYSVEVVAEGYGSNEKILFIPQKAPSVTISLKKPVAICVDSDVSDKFSDGKNYYLKGTTKSTQREFTDSCEGSVLNEYYCSGGSAIGKAIYKCPAGCKDGACQKETVVPISKCSDSTVFGQCSSLTKPLYCDNGTLIKKCASCGCENGYLCQPDGSCLATAPAPQLIDCQKIYNKSYWCSGYDGWKEECRGQGEAIKIETPCDEKGSDYCVTCASKCFKNDDCSGYYCAAGQKPACNLSTNSCQCVGSLIPEGLLCSDCGKGILNICQKDECLGLGKCVFDGNWYGGGICASQEDLAVLKQAQARLNVCKKDLENIKDTLAAYQLEGDALKTVEAECKKVGKDIRSIDGELSKGEKSISKIAEINAGIDTITEETHRIWSQLEKPSIVPIQPSTDEIQVNASTTLVEGLGAGMEVKRNTIGMVSEGEKLEASITPKKIKSSTSTLPSGQRFIGNYIFNYSMKSSVTGKEITNFGGEGATITMTYSDSDIRGFKEDSLTIYYYDEASSQWVALPTTVDTVHNKLTAQSHHFTDFMMGGTQTGVPETAKDCADYCDNMDKKTMPVGMACLCSRDNPKCPASDPDCKHREEGIIDRATNWIFYFGLILAPLFILIGAFMFFTAGGESKRTTGAKKVIIWSVVGLAVALCTKLIYQVIRFLIGQ